MPYAHRYWAARKPEWNSEILSNTILFSLIVGGVITFLAWQLIPYFIGTRTPEVVWYVKLFLLNIPVILLSEMLRGQLEGARCFGWLGVGRFSFIGIQAGGYVVFYLFGWLTLKNALLIITVGQILCALLMLLGVLIELSPRWHASRKVLGEEIGYGLRGYSGIVTEYAILRLDQMMLAGMASSPIIGLYAVAVALAEITATLASSVADALLPEVAASDSKEKATNLLAKSLRLTLYAHLLVLIPLWFASPFILEWIYGAEFVAATAALRVLLIASIVWSVGLIVISGLNGFGHPGLGAVARLASAVTTVSMLLWLLPKWGIMGAAVSSLIGYSVMFLVALFWLWQKCSMGLWESLRPRRQDVSLEKLKSIFSLAMARPRKIES